MSAALQVNSNAKSRSYPSALFFVVHKNCIIVIKTCLLKAVYDILKT